MKKLFKIFDWYDIENKVIELEEEEGNFLKTLEAKHNITIGKNYIIIIPKGESVRSRIFSKKNRIKLEKLGYKKDYSISAGKDYYIKYFNYIFYLGLNMSINKLYEINYRGDNKS
jgi:hypothetical protein